MFLKEQDLLELIPTLSTLKKTRKNIPTKKYVVDLDNVKFSVSTETCGHGCSTYIVRCDYANEYLSRGMAEALAEKLNVAIQSRLV